MYVTVYQCRQYEMFVCKIIRHNRYSTACRHKIKQYNLCLKICRTRNFPFFTTEHVKDLFFPTAGHPVSSLIATIKAVISYALLLEKYWNVNIFIRNIYISIHIYS